MIYWSYLTTLATLTLIILFLEMFKFLIFNFRITNNYEGKYWIFKEYFICWNENELIIWQTCVVATNVFFILCLYYKIRFFFILKKKFLFFITRCKHIPLSLYICVPYTNTSPSLGGFIPLFPLGAPSYLLEFNPKVSWGVWSCCECPHPLGVNFGLFRDHYYFVSSSTFKFILALFRFFDGVQPKASLDFFRHVQVGFHPFNSPFN
jgi:hypothetical protein